MHATVRSLPSRHPLALAALLQIVCICLVRFTGFSAWRETLMVLAAFSYAISRNVRAIVLLGILSGHLAFHQSVGSSAEAVLAAIQSGHSARLPPTQATLAEVRPLSRGWTSIATLETSAPIATLPNPHHLAKGTRIAVRGHTQPPEPWTTTTLVGPLQIPDAARNPGEWDPRAQLRKQGVLLEIHTRNHPTDQSAPHKPLDVALNSALASAIQSTDSTEEESIQLLRSSLLGVSGDSLASVIRDFRATGTLHLFAVSGMNIAVLAIITRILVRPIGLISPIGITFSVLCITIYAIATRLAPSCQRALLMAIIPLLAPLVRRPSTLLDTLTATVAILLTIHPNMLFDIGFQLSVALVVGLASISPILSNPIRPDPKQQLIPETLLSARHRFIRAAHCAMADSIGIAVTASIVSLPWSILVFRQIPLHAPLINLVAVPLANLQLVGAFAAILLAPIPSVSHRITDANLHVARSLASVVRSGAKIPGATLTLPTPALKGADFLLLDVPSACVALLGNPERSSLVNTGSETNFRAVVARALTAHGTVAPHSVLLTTGDSAHLGGAVALLESSPPSAWYLPRIADRSPHHRHLREWLDARGIPKRFLLVPNAFQLPDGSNITCLHPPNGFHASSAADNATVLLWEKRGTRMLLTGTAGFATEQLLAQLPREKVQADIWFKGLHPRDVSGSPTLLEHIDPRVVVINRNPYRASDPSVTSLRNLCASRGTALLEMDATGAIVGSISPQAVKLTPFRSGEPCIEIPIEPQRFGRK